MLPQKISTMVGKTSPRTTGIEPVNGAHSSRDGAVMNVYYDLNDN